MAERTLAPRRFWEYGDGMPPAEPSDSEPANASLWPLLRTLLLVGVVLGLWLWWARQSGFGAQFQPEVLVARVKEAGWWGPVVLALVAVLAPLLLFPRWPVAVAAGLLYGVVLGTAFAVGAAMGGAALQFFLAKNWLAPRAKSLRERYRWTRWLERPERAFTTIVLLRCTPMTHFSVTNLAAGSLGVRWRDFLGATFVGMIPSTAMYASMGKVAREPSPRFLMSWVALVAVVVVMGVFIPRWRKGSAAEEQG